MIKDSIKIDYVKKIVMGIRCEICNGRPAKFILRFPLFTRHDRMDKNSFNMIIVKKLCIFCYYRFQDKEI